MFFKNPVNSVKLDIYQLDEEFESDIKTFDVDSIEAKMMCLSYQTKKVFIPILHSLEILNK